ncbi:hypothetical protein [Teredinibacter sp. KSP-S5-2]|uniref:hypothetical protein n=1 Tax=Teredinibacter sp. KSP-S5-2 TaxID=3034506 RepID=UPI0029349F7D|nr:hypothetical protein [Teredinibacter sp. KSP-S5-2]WNO10312.1 hypothetical protein P5V12_03910 [Teredinibacter sp. KSP-S5-2]
MKKLVFFVLFFFSLGVRANPINIDGVESYLGKIDSVAMGFFAHAAVGLPSDTTCKGKRMIVLLKSNANFDYIYSTLLAAVASKSDVHLYRVAAGSVTFGGTEYCAINEAAFGRFPSWPVGS